MNTLILELRLLLSALSLFLPLLPPEGRARVGDVLEAAARALNLTSGLAQDWTALTQKLAAVRGEVEALTQSGRPLAAEDLEQAMARVRTASHAFRAALDLAEQAPG